MCLDAQIGRDGIRSVSARWRWGANTRNTI
jgi:hypothetical protein